MNLWKRFRALPTGTQAAAWIALAAVYTVALILILGGGDDGSGSGTATTANGVAPSVKNLDPKEKRVAEDVTGAKVKVAEPNDVKAFRKPTVTGVQCKDDRCEISYTSGLPGRGRIFEDQQRMLAKIYEDETINTVLIRVFRAGQVGPRTPAKATEETAPGTPILVTECHRTGTPKRANAGSNVKVPPVPADCKSVPIGQGQYNANPGSAASSNNGKRSGEAGILGGG